MYPPKKIGVRSAQFQRFDAWREVSEQSAKDITIPACDSSRQRRPPLDAERHSASDAFVDQLMAERAEVKVRFFLLFAFRFFRKFTVSA